MSAEDGLCDGCGGLLPAADATGTITCPSCGRITHRAPDPVIEPPAPTIVDFSAWTPGPGGTSNFNTIPTVDFSAAADTAVKAGKVGCGIGSVVAIIGLIVAIGGVFFAVRSGMSSVKSATDAFTSNKSSASQNLFPDSGSAVVIPGGEGHTTNVITLVTDNSDSTSSRKLVRLELGGDEPKLVWTSESFPSDVYDVSLAMGGDNLYVGAKDEVHLLSLATGKEKWHSSLTDKITTSCSGCFATVGNNLVVRTDDAYLTGLGPSSPEQLWTKRLSSIGAKPSIVGSQVLLVDQVTGSPTSVQTLDAATGKVVRTISPTCPQLSDQYYPVAMSAGNRIYGVPGSTDLVSAFGYGPGCVVRWEPSSGTIRWATQTGDIAPSSDVKPLITATDMVFGSSGNGMVHVNLANGAAAELEPVADANAEPAAIVGRTLLGNTTTTRGTARGGLAAWSLDTNKHVWTANLPQGAQAPSQSGSDALFDGSPRSVLVTGGAQPHVVTFTGEGRTYTDQTIDITNGTLSQPVKKDFPSRYGDSGTVSLTVEDIAPTRLVISIDTLLEVIPVGNDGAVIRWPS